VIHWHSSATMGFFTKPVVFRTWSPTENHSEYNCYGLFTRMCSCEIIPPGMITRPVFIA
jgi:hypothetical protein